MVDINPAKSVGLSAALHLVSLSACSNGAVEPTWPPEVDGTWEWVRSVERSPEGEVLTPTSEGFSARLRLMADGSEGQFEYAKDGEVVDRGRFAIGYEDAPGNEFITWDPAFGPFTISSGSW